MADDFSKGDESTSSTSREEDEDFEKPMPKQITSLVGNIIVDSASKAAGAVGAGAKYVTSPNVWPNIDNVDNLVDVLTVTGYALTAFSIVGTTYFFTKTVREVFQWRSWAKYRRNVKHLRQRSTSS